MPAKRKEQQDTIEEVVDVDASDVFEEHLTDEQRLDEMTLILKGIEYEKQQRIALAGASINQLQNQLEAQLASLTALEQSYKERREQLAKFIKRGN